MALAGDGKHSGRNDYETPWEVVRALEARFGRFDLDVCATRGNAKAQRYLSPVMNALEEPWEADCAFMNPPYGRGIERWVKKAFAETFGDSARAGRVVGLLPGNAQDTEWWHLWCLHAEAKICSVRGRIQFLVDGERSANSPINNVVVVWDRGHGAGLSALGYPFNFRRLEDGRETSGGDGEAGGRGRERVLDHGEDDARP